MEQIEPEPHPDRPAAYQIKAQGMLDETWSDWFGGMAVEFENGITTLTGEVTDQAALRGVLCKLWDLNLALISLLPYQRECGHTEKTK